MLAQIQTRTLNANPFLGNPSIKLSDVSSQMLSRSHKQRKAKEKRDSIMGFEVCQYLHWQNWELGKEITKHLTVKNVRLKTQKLKFSPPSTRFFSTIFPQCITLRAGTSFTLPITFRPLEKCDYEDSLVFEAEEGSFSVALRGTLPRHQLHFQEALRLPMCAVCDTSEASFVMHNMSELQTQFKWEVPQPFIMIPDSGVLDPKCEIRTKVLFQPRAALVHDVTATCRFGVNEEYERSIRLTSIAKYPHLLVNVPLGATESPGEGPSLQFGPVGVGMVAEKYIEISNPTMVDSPFRIERAKQVSQIDCNFYCNISHAVAPAQGKLRIPLQFRPRTVGMESVDYFHVIPAGGLTKTVLKVSGSCQGPCFSLVNPMLDFGLVHLGEQILHTLEITNFSDVPAHYQFDIDSKESVFSFNRPRGTLGPRDTQSLQVIFSPVHPIQHYRRVTCLVHHQDPLFLDLIGTCHSDMDKPAILLPKHVLLYRTNMVRGLTFYPPDILGTMLHEGKLGTDTDGALMLLPQDPSEKSPENFTNEDPVSEVFCDEFSSETSMFPSHITASTRDFDFGRCVGSGPTATLPFTLANHTKGKLTVTWISKPNSPFRVNPECTDIPPLKSTAFRLVFQPSQSNALYSGELEGFIFYKVLRDYRNVEDATICPPWCITMRARGHTFELGHEHFVPNCVLDSPRMVFPPVNQNGDTLRSLLLQNTGPSMMTYIMDHEKCSSIQVMPSAGHIDPGSHQIVLLRGRPKENRLTRHCLPVQFNYSPDYIQEIVLFSRAETPQLFLEGEGKLFFKPTCVGTQSECSYSLKNCSRVPLHFEWKIQQADTPFFSVCPTRGIIRPNESVAQTWSFVPQEEKTYFAKAAVLTWAAQPGLEPNKKSRYVLRFTGDGCKGTISTQQEQVDLGDILVGSSQSYDLLLCNNGNCTLEYTLSAKQEITGPCDPDDIIHDPINLEFENGNGKLPARTKLPIRITAHPSRRLQYTWTISYCILTPKVLDPTRAISEERVLCCVTAQGVYPTFSIVDLCPSGSAITLNKTQLWRLFSLERLNTCLQSDPTPGELIYRVPTRHSTRRRPSINTPVLLDFNFGAAPVGTEPFVVLLLLENSGIVPVTWDFLFPADQQIELEFWAETWEFDPSEIHQMRIQDNKLFTVSPKSGSLAPGQQQTVQLLYRHDFVGTDRLPVLLKVSHGREILLNFIGVTVEKEQRYVHFTSTKHTFTPVAIGSTSPSKQIYELFNGGSVAGIYEIQLEPLREIKEQNYHHPIFQCLNPRGEILPGSTACVEWIFSPLEAKTYSVNVPVHILGGDSALITFEGIGYDRNVLGKAAVFETFTPLSATPRLSIPGQVAYLTQQRIAFGDMPIFCKSSRLLFLNNSSETESVYFAWYAGSPNASETLKVSPMSGLVRPRESASITVTLQAGEQAEFYSLDLVCEVFMEKALATYEQELLDWEEEEEYQSVEFTINEKSSDKKSHCAVEKCGLASSGPGMVKGSQRLPEIRKYKTLPPIKNFESVRPPASRDRESRTVEKEAKRIWARPKPPAPSQLHLSVTGRSHHTSDFLSQFQNDIKQHFQYRLSKELDEKPELVDQRPETVESEMPPRKPTVEEQEMATDIMASIIRSLLDDKHFHEELVQNQHEPLPYFSQFRSQEKPPGTADISEGADISSCDQNPEVSLEEEEAKTAGYLLSPEVLHEETERKQQDSKKEELQEKIKRIPTFSHLVESILENTLQNILIEANRGEVVLTSRPRVIALPPATPRGISPTSTARTLSTGQNITTAAQTRRQQNTPECPGPVVTTEIQ
ncbi:cilia- and flagella-associated protein 65 [Rhinophrynus dorsalis]